MTRTQATNTANSGGTVTQQVDIETKPETTDVVTGMEETEERGGSETKVEIVEISKPELDALMKERAQLRRDQRNKDEKLQQIEQRRLEEEGQYKELADQYKADAEKSKQQYETLRREQTCRDIAQKLNFVNPAHAYRLLDPTELDIDDRAGIEDAFKQLAKESPYLISPATGKTGLSMPSKDSSVTADEAIEKLANMTRQEKRDMSDEEFKALQNRALGI